MNKHITAALIIAPILALIAYFAVDYVVREVPQKIEDNASYKLLVKPNCRWKSGQCTLTNNDVKLALTVQEIDNQSILFLTSKMPLTGVYASIVEQPSDNNTVPQPMATDNNKLFSFVLNNFSTSMYLQLAISIDKSIFYAVAPLVFTEQEENRY